MAVALVRSEILYGWAGPSLLIVDVRGECGPAQQLSGFYFREARFLDALRLEVNGKRPWLCEAAAVRADLLTFNFVHPEIQQPGGGGTGQAGDEEKRDEDGIPERSLDLTLAYRLRPGRLLITLRIGNSSRQAVSVRLGLHAGADFADIQEAQSGGRQQSAAVDVEAQPGRLTFAYGHAQLPYRTEVRHGDEWQTDGSTLRASVTLEPRETRELALSVAAVTGRDDIDESGSAEREWRLDAWRGAFASVEAPANRTFESAVACNVRDIASFPLLDGPRDEWLATQAGMPLYPAFFGRDALTAGWQAACLDRGAMLSAALVKLGRLQSSRFDDWRDEEPGRIPYQVRTGPLALLNLNPYAAYYADFASPLMFVVSLANLWAWTGDRADVARHWDTARRILDWAREHGDRDGDGYLEYLTRSPMPTKNQGWKDSGDAIVYDDGSPVPAPIATCELQGYWYIAQQLMAVLAIAMGARSDAAAYRDAASALKARFNRDWWMEDESFIALAMDPDKRPVRALTSNAGHCIACGIVSRDRLPALVGRMFAPDVFSGWGVRTLSTGHAFYNPLSYHRGTVWAVEQATIMFGLRRFGFDARALDLAGALFDLARLYPEFRIPECVGGYSRAERPVPGAYPRANTPQLWNATAFPLAIQSMLGLIPLAPVNTLVIDPALPAWLPDLVLRDLRVGGSKVSLRFWREGGVSRWEVLHKQGDLRVVRQPAPESLSAGWTDRLAGIVESLSS